jgi:WD40 repeat protein/serine/threonine protein kinase
VERAIPSAGVKQSYPEGLSRIPDYELIRRIGGGGYGEVWLARNLIGAFRAVKIIYRNAFADERPFEREFNGIKKFEPISRSHESQVNILHVGRNGDYFYYVMELADDAGPYPPAPCSSRANSPLTDASASSYAPRTLKLESQRRGRLPVPECVKIGISLTTALGHLHRHGLVHRDVKPSNVIFINGVPKLADIGLVTDFDATVSCVGTEGFLPPEGPGSPQADLFALGKVLYEISTGKDRKDYPEPPTLLGEYKDRQEMLELGEVIKKACAPNPRDRFASAEQMQADLLLLNAGKSVRQTRLLERRVKLLTRTAVVLVAVILLGVVPYAWALLEARRARRAEAQSREQLWSSYLAQAKALRLSHEPGGRADALRALKAAAEIRLSPQLRNEAVAALALTDLQLKKVWPPSDGARIFAFDIGYERYVYVPTNGPPSIRRVVDDSEVTRLTGYIPPVPQFTPGFEFSPDGRFLLAWSRGSAARPLDLWDLNTGDIAATFEGELRAPVFSPDSHSLAFSEVADDTNGVVKVYDLTSNPPVLKHETTRGIRVSYMQFHPSREMLATCSNDSDDASVWDLASGALVYHFPHPKPVRQVDWDPKGDLLATACEDGNVYIWALTSPEWPKHILVGHDMGVTDVSFSFDGVFLASRAWDGTMRIWDTATAQLLFRFPSLGYSLGFSHPHYRFYHAGGVDKFAVSELLPSRECRLLRPKPPGARSVTCDFSFDGRWLLTCHKDGVRIWNPDSGEIGTFLPEEGTLWAVFGPGANHCLVASKSGIKEWSLTSDAQGRDISFAPVRTVSSAAASELLLSCDGTTLVFSFGEQVHIMNLPSGEEKTVPRADTFFGFTALSGHGKLAVGWPSPSIKEAGRINVFDTGTTNLLHQLHQHGSSRGAFSPDEKWFLVGDGVEYRLWDADSWHSPYGIPQTERGTGFLGFMAFSPDSRIIAVVLGGDTLRLIETTSGQELATLQAPELHDIGALLRFSPDGTRLAVMYGPGPVQLWDLRLIRQELAAMSLDWNMPPYPPASQRAAK